MCWNESLEPDAEHKVFLWRRVWMGCVPRFWDLWDVCAVPSSGLWGRRLPARAGDSVCFLKHGDTIRRIKTTRAPSRIFKGRKQNGSGAVTDELTLFQNVKRVPALQQKDAFQKNQTGSRADVAVGGSTFWRPKPSGFRHSRRVLNKRRDRTHDGALQIQNEETNPEPFGFRVQAQETRIRQHGC